MAHNGKQTIGSRFSLPALKFLEIHETLRGLIDLDHEVSEQRHGLGPEQLGRICVKAIKVESMLAGPYQSMNDVSIRSLASMMKEHSISTRWLRGPQYR